MKKWISAAAGAAFAVTAVAMVFVAGASAGNGTGITATSASTRTWANTSATFVRSASGIINETNRVSLDPNVAQNPWTSADVWLQFRPTTGPNGSGAPTPNPTCDPAGLVTTLPYSNNATLYPNIAGTPASGYFIGSNPYNVCVYLVNPVVASGTIDSSVMNGTTAALPTGLSGHFRIDVSGTYQNNTLNVADAEYTSTDAWATYTQGYNIDPWNLGEGFGDVQVNNAFVNWGAPSATHAYSLTGTYSGSVNLAVFDGYSNTNPTTKVDGWYGDNTGSLNYTITYLGL